MSKLSIVQLFEGGYECKGSCLRIPAEEVLPEEFKEKWLEKFIFDMFDTLYSNSSGVGLAANQVGVLKRICVIDIKRDGKSPIVLINPNYCPLGIETTESQEVCLSFPLVSSLVKRYKKIKVVYQDIEGTEQILEVEGFKALVFQHEIDHLNGIVHIDLNTLPEGLNKYIGYSTKMADVATSRLLKLGESRNERQ